MKTIEELHKMLGEQSFGTVDAHIHTHLCDGSKDMTVENIAKQAEASGMNLIILTPHFHKQVSDDTATLYEDTNEEILIKLREEINAYKGNVKILLSTEADILNVNGETSLKISKIAEDVLDLVTPTINYHPLLPLNAVKVTYGRCIEEIHKSGLYKSYAEKIGGVEKVLESLYETEANAIINSPYPAILGHFFAAHAYAVGDCNWFGAEEGHIEIIKKGAEKIIEACLKTGAMIDLTGIHLLNMSYEEKKKADGFFYNFQKWFIEKCRQKNIPIFPGTDSHGLGSVGDVGYYNFIIVNEGQGF